MSPDPQRADADYSAVRGAPSMKPAETVDAEVVADPYGLTAGVYTVEQVAEAVSAREALHDEAEREDASEPCAFCAAGAFDGHCCEDTYRLLADELHMQGVALVAVSRAMLVQLAREGSSTEPLAIVALVPRGTAPETFELVLRQPHRKELWAALGEAPRR